MVIMWIFGTFWPLFGRAYDGGRESSQEVGSRSGEGFERTAKSRNISNVVMLWFSVGLIVLSW